MVQETARINFETGNLDVVEGRIKALGGAINLLGGAVETTVGLMGLLGVDDKVQKQFQEAATSAIAFADGTKRIFEGYKELREAADLFRKAQAAGTAVTAANTVATTANNTAQASSVGLLGKARAAWNALTAAMIRNPITAVVVGLTALAGALFLYSQRADEAEEENKKLEKSNKDLLDSFKETQSQIDSFNNLYILGLKSRGASERTLLNEKKAIADENLENVKKEQEKITKQLEEKGKERDLLLKNQQNNTLKLTKDEVKERYKIVTDEYNELIKLDTEYYKLYLDAETKSIEAALNITEYNTKQRQANAEQRANEAKMILEEAKKQKDFQDSLNEQLSLINKEGRDKELLELGFWYENQQKLANGNSITLLTLIELFEAKKREIEVKYDNLELQRIRERNQKIREEEEKAKQELIKTEQDKNERINQLLGIDAQIKRNQEIKLLQERLQTLREMGDQETLLYKQIQDAITKLQNEGLKERSSKLKEFFESDAAKTIGASLQALNQVTSGILSIAQESSERRLNNIEAEYSARINAIQGTDEQAAAQREALEEQMNAKMEAERRKAFEDQKKLRIADTLTSGISSAFQAFSSAIGQLGPIAGPVVGGILSAMILAQMAATIANIKKTKYTSTSTGGGGGGGGAGVGGMTVSNTGGEFSGGGQFGGNLSSGGSTPMSSGGSTAMAAPPVNPNTPIRAYVVANDVSSGLDAQQALDNRRTF